MILILLLLLLLLLLLIIIIIIIIIFTITKLISQDLLKENVPENQEIQVRTLNRSLRTPNKFTLEYKNLQKQQ